MRRIVEICVALIALAAPMRTQAEPPVRVPPGSRSDAGGTLVSGRGLRETSDFLAAELARRLFATGQVAGVHVYSNIVTVDLGSGQTANGLADVVRNLYQYWKPGMEPPVFEDVEPAAEESAAVPAAGGDSASDAALSEAAKRVPAHLLERSRAARERWKAKQAG